AKAQTAAGMPPKVEEPVRGFMSQLDGLMKQPSSDKLFGVVFKNNLKRFVEGLTTAPSPPQSWSTDILIVDRIDPNRVELYVALKVRTGGRDHSGTGVYTLYRNGAGWMVENFKVFSVSGCRASFRLALGGGAAPHPPSTGGGAGGHWLVRAAKPRTL